MCVKRSLSLSSVISIALGYTAGIEPAMAVVDGAYDMVILPTPIGYDTVYSSTFYRVGTDGAWNSSFHFAGHPSHWPDGMTDNGAMVVGGGVGFERGSSIAGDGYAGVIGLQIASGNISVDSFNVDTIFNTLGGDFSQYANAVSAMTGTVDEVGNMIFTPVGRLAATGNPVQLDLPWNIDNIDCALEGCTVNSNTDYNFFTTGTHMGGGYGGITGTPFVDVGDINGDGLLDYTGVIVSAGRFGTMTGVFFGTPYFETWRVQLLSTAVPIPAAAWLFCSGLIGLLSCRRRCRTVEMP